MNNIAKPRAIMLGAALLTGAALLGLPLGKSGLTAQPVAEPTIVGGPPVVRRLTESQYRASIADIFGPDAPILGRFERGMREHGLLALGTSTAQISSSSLEQYHVSAQGIAAYALSAANRDKVLTCKPAAENTFDSACAQRFIEQYGLILFRRPVTSVEVTRNLKVAQAAQERLGSFYKGMQFTLAGMLVAPEFLLRVEQTAPGKNELNAYSKASRLSFMLVDATPDQELLRAAGAGELDTDAGLTRQADRLLASPKYERAIRAFFQDLLNLDDFAELSKDAQIFPAFNSSVATDAQEQTLRTIVDLLVARKGDYRDIFTTRDTFMTRSLGIVYHLPVGPRKDWLKTQFPVNSGRAGILTHASFLELYAHPGISSPTLRGKFIRQTFLCQKVPDPPANVDFSKFQGPEAVLPTARARLASHSVSPACAGCHRLTDPIGLTLENFDGLGTFRTQESDAVIDASGVVDGKKISGPVALGQALHDDPRVSRCLAQKVYETGSGSPADSQQSYVDYLVTRFKQQGYRLPDLMRAIVTSRSFYSTSLTKPATTALSGSNTGDPS